MRTARFTARRGEEGAALAISLAFLVLCAVVASVVLSYTSASERVSGRLAVERDDVYAASGAVDTAIKLTQGDDTLGSIRDAASRCAMPGATTPSAPVVTTTKLQGRTVTVTCAAAPTSGASLGSTSKPGFAILTLAPYHGPNPPGDGSPSATYPACKNSNDELGLVVTQFSKTIRVKGDVRVNSDVDADTWDTRPCPGYFNALPIIVEGNVLQRESDNDFCAGPVALDTQCTPFLPMTSQYTYAAPLPSPTADQLGQLQDPGLGPLAAAWAPNPSPVAAGTVRDAANNVITSCPAADPVTGFRVVKFTPGRYGDVNVLNNFMNGACPNAVFWFQPGTYTFDFANSGSHEWVINDTTTRVVGGQPFRGPDVAPQTFSQTWRPTSFTQPAASGTSVQFSNPANAYNIDLATADATLNGNQSSTLTLSGFNFNGATSIPADAQINSVRLRLSHAESVPALVGTQQLTVTTPSGQQCTAVPVPTTDKHVGVLENSYDITSCLNVVTKIDNTVKVEYKVAHCTGTANGCTTAPVTVRLDGAWLNIDYTIGGRLSWDPSNQATITPSSPNLPGACLKDGDRFWSDGVQFQFAGDSRVNLKSGRVELCDQQRTQSQEIVVYGLPQGSGTTVGPNTWAPQSVTNGSNGFTNSGNARVVDGVSATASISSGTPRTLTLSQFSPTTWPIPAANQIPAGSTIDSVTVRVTHFESSGAATPTFTLTPGGSSTACSGLAALTKRTTIGTDDIDVKPCLDSVAKLNGGVSFRYSATRTSSSTQTANLDGVQLRVTYTPPVSNCITKTPYYNPAGNKPAFNGACAVLRVSDNDNGGSFPRVLTMWGTVYAPQAAIDVPVDIMTVPVFNRGVAARMIMLGYNLTNDAPVPITTTPSVAEVHANRRVTFTASIAAPGGGQKTTQVTADVEFCDADGSACPSGTGGVKVWSWKVTP